MQIEVTPTEDIFNSEEYHNEIIEHFKFVFQQYIESCITIKHNFVVNFSYNPTTTKFKLLDASQNYKHLLIRAIEISSDKLIHNINIR